MNFLKLIFKRNTPEAFEMRSACIKNIFSKTIAKLNKLNIAIDKQIEKENETIQELKKTISEGEDRKCLLKTNKEYNDKLRSKFEDFISID